MNNAAAGMGKRKLGAGMAAFAVLVSVLAGGQAGASAAVKVPAGQAAFRAALQQIVRDGIPGAIGLQRRGDQVNVVTDGLADLATAQPMTGDDRFRVGSITKTFVATLILKLVAAHRLRLTDSVARWLPGLVPGGRAITLHELLQHTSGIYNYTSDPGFIAAVEADYARVWKPRELVQIAVAHPPLFPPGTSYSYSNTEYILLGLVAEAATGQPLGRELREQIFTPLGLRATSFPYADTTLPVPHADGYFLGQPGGPLDTTKVSPSAFWAAGAVVSTANNLARFYSQLLAGRLLPAPLLRAMLQTVPIEPGARYGLGIFSLQLPCGTVWGHNGDVPGYYSWAFTTRNDSRQVVVFANADLNTLSAQQNADVISAVSAGICGVGGSLTGAVLSRTEQAAWGRVVISRR
jgi:D-alanyl-D-alanine carboxypeptidase